MIFIIEFEVEVDVELLEVSDSEVVSKIEVFSDEVEVARTGKETPSVLLLLSFFLTEEVREDAKIFKMVEQEGENPRDEEDETRSS